MQSSSICFKVFVSQDPSLFYLHVLVKGGSLYSNTSSLSLVSHVATVSKSFLSMRGPHKK
uniref:Uncharacterized protein n=1 Tax=Rhizophora mucronata TaxID=61149 RepID=A0A2P2K5F3_RHIMU